MKRFELAGTYLAQYEDTDVTIIDVKECAVADCVCQPIVFDLSDGTHWFSDDNDTCRVANSLTDLQIGWNDTYGWIILNDDGSESHIEWL